MTLGDRLPPDAQPFPASSKPARLTTLRATVGLDVHDDRFDRSTGSQLAHHGGVLPTTRHAGGQPGMVAVPIEAPSVAGRGAMQLRSRQSLGATAAQR